MKYPKKTHQIFPQRFKIKQLQLHCRRMHRTPAYLTAQSTAVSPYSLNEGLLKIQLLSKTELKMQRCTLHLCTISQPGLRNSNRSFAADLQDSATQPRSPGLLTVQGDDPQLTVEVRGRPGEVRSSAVWFGCSVLGCGGRNVLSDWSGRYFYHLCYSRLIFDRTGKCITFKL